ncbi:MAG TPA: hypothetical protein VFR07_18130 [Mycobacteriales bacterium]|nr:hypothetical protein [Mycobacteriales bacterium]
MGGEAERSGDPSRQVLRRRLQGQLQRAREVQRANLLARLHAETTRARAVQALVVLNAEQSLRDGS